MSRKRKPSGKGRGRILDVFTPPDDAGEPVGCIATTYTFDPGFFEEECVARFLSMETDAREQGAAYLIEREEKLQKACISVIVDRANAVGDHRSLAWDVLSVRVPGRCMHAKVTLLVWSKAVRVVIGSANLSKPAYRANLEVYGALDFVDGVGEPIALLEPVLAFLEALARMAPELTPQKRTLELLRGVRERTRGWISAKRVKDEQPEVHVVFGGDVGSGAASALRSLREDVWPDSRPPRSAFVWSPFFDNDADAAATALIGCLAKRGERDVTLNLATFKEPDGVVAVQAPESLVQALPDAVIEPVILVENEEARVLHAKAYRLENDRAVVYMLGSSNFTCAGLGVGTRSGNIEANLAYAAWTGTPAARALTQCWPATGGPLDRDGLRFKPAFDDGELGQLDEGTCLPSGFLEATFDVGEGVSQLVLRLDRAELPERFGVAAVDTVDVLVDASTPSSDDGIVRVVWPHQRPPTALVVTWFDEDGATFTALWLVNVRDRSSLPPPEELRNLSLETLLDILTMARPMYEAVLRALERERAAAQSKLQTDLDPHRRVNTETFLLKRTKRFSRALETLRAQLELPMAVEDALRAKLRGHIGPLALADAVARERVAPGEIAFLLAEIALCLGRVRIVDAPGCLESGFIRQELRQVVLALEERVAPSLPELPLEMLAYVRAAFARDALPEAAP